MQQILYFSYQSSESGRRKLQGFLRFAQTRSWQVEVLVGPHPAKSLRKVLDFWKAAGCVLETRIDLAKSYLRRPDLAVDSIANFAGWKTYGAFRKAFLAHTGLTPQAWRAANA